MWLKIQSIFFSWEPPKTFTLVTKGDNGREVTRPKYIIHMSENSMTQPIILYNSYSYKNKIWNILLKLRAKWATRVICRLVRACHQILKFIIISHLSKRKVWFLREPLWIREFQAKRNFLCSLTWNGSQDILPLKTICQRLGVQLGWENACLTALWTGVQVPGPR